MSLSLIFLLLPVLIIVGVVLLIVSLASKRGTGKGESFPRVVRLVYLYAVTIVSLFVSIGGFIFAWNHAVDYFIPDMWRYHPVIQEHISDSNRNHRALRGLCTSIAAVAVGASVFIYHSGKMKNK